MWILRRRGIGSIAQNNNRTTSTNGWRRARLDWRINSSCHWQLDAAIRRRFQGRIHISLPDLRGRIEMFKISIGTTPYAVSHANPEEFGKTTEDYSGINIAIAVQDVLRQPVRKIQTLEHYKNVQKKLCLIYLKEHGLFFEARSLLKALRSLEEAQ